MLECLLLLSEISLSWQYSDTYNDHTYATDHI